MSNEANLTEKTVKTGSTVKKAKQPVKTVKKQVKTASKKLTFSQDINKQLDKLNLKKVGSNFSNKKIYNFDSFLPEISKNTDLQKKFRSKFRKITYRKFNNLCLSYQDKTLTDKEIKDLFTFYKTFYLSNSFELDSLINPERTKNESTKQLLKVGLQILQIFETKSKYLSKTKTNKFVYVETKNVIEYIKKLAK